MFLQIYSFIQAHQGGFAAVIVALLDFAIELHPGLAGNNIVSQILAFFKPKTPPSA